MEAEYKKRKQQLLDECKVAPQVFEEVLPRLEAFMKPYVKCLARKEQIEHAHTFVQGLLSDLDHKNVESIAYRFGQQRLPLQWFVGYSDWDERPMRDELVRQVGEMLGEAAGVLVFDPSAFPKSGRESVGVARQWCGRLGKTENCQVAVYMAYVSSREHALVDTRLYLPREWAQDRQRRKKAGVPKEVRYRTRHQLCLEMLEQNGPRLPHAWIAGDDELGQSYRFRRRLHTLGEQYLLAVPSNRLVRDLEATPPAYGGFGRPPKPAWTRVDKWASALEDDAWTRIDVRDGAKGPLVVEAVKCRVVARTDKQQEGHPEVLVVIRYRDRDDRRVVKIDYYFSNASPQTPLAEFARVAKAEHRVEECLQRGKSEAGLADYEVRNWKGWHHHQVLSLIATWFLVTEARRGKKMDTSDHGGANSRAHRAHPASRLRMRYDLSNPARVRRTAQAKRTRSLATLEAT
jgi:SRSO17 transposase